MGEALNKYFAEVLCTNCGFKGPVSPKVGEYVSMCSCPICQCRALRPTAEEDYTQALMRNFGS